MPAEDGYWVPPARRWRSGSRELVLRLCCGRAAGTPGTLHRIRATLRAALNAAVREGLRPDNPARHVELPGPRRPHAQVWTDQQITAWRKQGQRPIVAVWTAQQLATFLATITDDRH